MLTYADRYWELCGRVSEASMSMIFMRGADSLANAQWSTYDPPHTSTYESPSGGNTHKKQKNKAEGGQRGESREETLSSLSRKLVGGYEEGSNGWRQLHAWVAGQEVEVAPSRDEPGEEEVLTALRGWQELLPTHTAFTLEAAEQIIAEVYSQRRSKWWSGVGAGN
jgi:hypothetical protein